MISAKNYKEYGENHAHANGLNLSISTKKTVEICNQIRKKNIQEAKKLLEDVIILAKPMPMKRFNRDTAHKKGIGPGRYPVKAAKQVLKILESAEANAQNKGLSTHHLIIEHISAHKASTPWHYGRQRRRQMKRTHLEVVVKEEKKSQEKKDKK